MINFSTTNTFGQFIERIGSEYGDKTAFIYRPRYRAIRWTYTDLLHASQMFAAQLEEQKVRKGDRVILWAGNSPYWVAAFFGCQLKGAVAVPLGPQNTPKFVKKITGITKAKLIVKNAALPGKILDTKTISVESTFDNWREKSRTFKKEKTTKDDLAEILFTSGTTGEPKGVKLKHSNILSNVEAISGLGVITNGDRIISFLPLSHIFEQVGGLFTPLAWGNPITQAASLSSLHIRLNMAEDHPTKMTAVPEFLKLALGRIEDTAREEGKMKTLETLYRLGPKLPIFIRRKLGKDIIHNFGGSLDTVIAGGAPMDPEVGRKFEAFGIRVLQGYGATETSPVIAVNTYERHSMDSVGPVIDGVEVRLGEDGEIFAKGPNVVDGYYKNPEKTKEAFKDGWYATDDIGFFDDEGLLHIQGRKKFLIVRPTGENVFPIEIEDMLGKQPNVSDSAVVGVELDGQFEVHAVLLPKRGKKLDGQKIIDAVNKNLEPHQRLDGFSYWSEDDFPRSATRKVKKPLVVEWLMKKGSKKTKSASGTIGGVERVLGSITGKNPKSIKPSSKLVGDLKMDSLQRVVFVAAMEEDLGVLLDEGEISPKTTVKEIKERLADKKNRDTRYPFLSWPLSKAVLVLRQVVQYGLGYPIAFVSSRLHIEGKEHLKDVEGPILLYANHISSFDAGFILRALPMGMRWKMAIAAASDAIWENPIMKRYLKFLVLSGNIYPISRREQVKAGLEYSGRLVDRGYSLLIFPESYISKDAKLQPLKQGAGFFAVEMDIPVYPVYITGTEILNPFRSRKYYWWKRPRVKIQFGERIPVSSKELYTQATAKINAAMVDLEKETLAGE